MDQEEIMQAVLELTRVRQKLQQKVEALQEEVTSIDRAIRVLERENPSRINTVNGSSGRQFKKMGLSESCLAIVGGDLVKPSTVRDRLTAGGYPMQTKTKLLSSVFATLRRLADRGQLEAGTIDGKRAFRRHVEKLEVSAGDAMSMSG